MNAEVLLKHFDRIAEAPDAVARLRQFVLDLAVRGKLVEQDPQDEPAEVLLERIQKKRSLQPTPARSRRNRRLPELAANEAPFSIPTNWKWVRIREVTADRGQTTPDNDFTYIDVSAIDKEAGRIARGQVLTPEEAPSRARKIVCAGDVLYSCVRPYLLNIAIVDEGIDPAPIASTAFAVLNGFGLVLARYQWIVLRSPFMVGCVESKMRGQAYPAINDADFSSLPFPLPPLAEQHRIVAKVDELMTLCDELGAARNEREARRDRLVASSLHRLQTAPDIESEEQDADQPVITLRAAARFHLDHRSRLVMRSEHIKQLRQTILDLAVRGKLAPQVMTDKPAAELLARIQFEKSRLVRERKYPQQKSPEGVPSLDFELPPGWEAIQVGNVCSLITSGSRGWAEYYADKGSKFIRAQNIRFGHLRLNDLAYVNPPKSIEGRRTQVSKGDLMVVITGAGVTKPAVLDHDLGEAYVSQHVALIKPVTPSLSRWLLLCLMSGPGGRKELVERAYGAGRPGLNLGNIRSLSAPLPPLAEQERILRKVDELLVLCDKLEAQFTATETHSRLLLEAVLRDALAPAEEESAALAAEPA